MASDLNRLARLALYLGAVALAALAQANDVSTNVPTKVSPALQSKPKPKIAVVIDDLGQSKNHNTFAALKLPLTLAIMPFTPNAEQLAVQATAQGHEVIIHMPMQAEQQPQQQQGVLDEADTKAQFIATLSAAVSRVPQAVGLNNHQGSKLTAAETQMQWLMAELKQQSLYFLDSRTTVATVAEHTARDYGVATQRRHVFLDNDASAAAIAEQWQQALRVAEKQGFAIVIGHPYPTTLAFLQQLSSSTLETVDLVYLSQLITAPHQVDVAHSTAD